MSDLELFTDSSPFDGIRHLTAEGREYWSARELQPLLDYDQWRNFAEAISRARISGHNAGHEMASHIAGASKMVEIGSGAERAVDDCHLSRLACYLIAMNGDPRKKAVADAQTYFAIKTREAEVSHTATLPAIPKTYAEALRAAADQSERAELAESKVRELAPAASSWNELADAAGDYSVADAAKVLSRDPNIATGERRLFTEMAAKSWIFRSEGRWRAYQSQVDCGRLVEKINRPYVNGAGETVAPAPTIRITPKGIAALHKMLGGGEQLALMAVAE